MDKPACANCRFFTKPGEAKTAYGDCVRYPEPIIHDETFWCGEHQPALVSIKEPAAQVPKAPPPPKAKR